jgi:hypothetical protein
MGGCQASTGFESTLQALQSHSGCTSKTMMLSAMATLWFLDGQISEDSCVSIAYVRAPGWVISH